MPLALRIRTTGLIATLLTCTCGTTYAQPIITDLGVVPGAPDSYATGLSLDGTVVVGSCNGTQRAWRWTQASGMVVLPLGPGASTNLAAAVSGDGVHTAGSVFSSVLNRRIPKFWINADGPLGFLLPSPWDGGTMNDVSSDGTYYVGVLTNSNAPSNKTAVRFGNTVDIIPPVANRSASEAVAVSADGQVVAGTASQPSNRAFRWTAANGSQDIGLVPGTSDTAALGMSADGSTIFGESRTSSNLISAFKWTDATGIVALPTSVPTLQPRATCSTADGSVIFGTNAYSLPDGSAMVWIGDAPSVFLHDYLQTLGVHLSGWQLTGVAGASSDGTVIAGTGIRSGVQHAFVVSGLPRLCGPSITLPTQSQFVLRGDTTTLTIVASSNSALSYQWFDASGTALSEGLQVSGSVFMGSTSDTLTITNAQVADTTRYSCRVTDACSSVMSSPARVVVNYPCGQGQETLPAGTICTFTSQDCGNRFEFTRATGGVLMVEYTTPLTHCSDVGMRFFVDGALAATSNFLAPGESSGVFDVGPVSPTFHTISMEAFGREGGCNGGELEAWSGEVTITTSISSPSISTVSVNPLACESTPASYEISVSGGGPALVTWEISDPSTPGNWLPIAEGVNLATSSALAFLANTTPSGESLALSARPGFTDDWTSGSALIRARAQNSCNVVYSDDLALTVQLACGPLCDSIDFNNDTSLFDPQDIDAFLSVYSEGPCIPEAATCNDIDFNNDGSVFDPCDIDSFLLQFSEGPCTLCGQ